MIYSSLNHTFVALPFFILLAIKISISSIPNLFILINFLIANIVLLYNNNTYPSLSSICGSCAIAILFMGYIFFCFFKSWSFSLIDFTILVLNLILLISAFVVGFKN